MKENKGITIVTLVITIIVLLILAGVSIGTGNKVIKSSELENVKTNMLLIKAKGKEYVENANFKLGTNFENATDKETRIKTAKAELEKGEEITKDNVSMFSQYINISEEQLTTDNLNYRYYYKLETPNLIEMGLSNVKSDEKSGWYIIKYDIKNVEVEVYNTAGFENEGSKYYSLTDIQNINL